MRGRRRRARAGGRRSTATLTSPWSQWIRATRPWWRGSRRRVDPVATGRPVFALANPGGRGLRVTSGSSPRPAVVPRAARAPHPGPVEHTAPLPAGLVGRPAGGRRRASARPEHGAAGGRADPRAAGRRGAAPARRRARPRRGPERPRLGVALAPPRAARQLRGAVGLPEREGLLVRGVQDGRRRATAGVERGDLLVAAGGRAAGRPRRPLRRPGGPPRRARRRASCAAPRSARSRDPTDFSS